jgi:hypothetical protein
MSCTSAQRLTAGKLPAGAEALLDLPLPPLDFGTFGDRQYQPDLWFGARKRGASLYVLEAFP